MHINHCIAHVFTLSSDPVSGRTKPITSVFNRSRPTGLYLGCLSFVDASACETVAVYSMKSSPSEHFLSWQGVGGSVEVWQGFEYASLESPFQLDLDFFCKTSTLLC